jgi:response regulator RpfG family c-di-GMP phosphodiesterase
MSDKILFVDDEPILLQGYQRLLRKEFQLSTAVGGTAALLLVKQEGPYGVVVSDMRMPEMNGVELLARVRKLAPDTVRIMLTGDSDLGTAIHAVNEGNIFRFLSKPANKDTLVKTLTDSLAQYHLVCAEKELLENTLRGTVYVLTEVLSLVSPAAFSRAARVRRYVQHVATKLSLASPWKYEVAAMMSQLGCVTVDPTTLETVYSGDDLSPDEEAQYATHPLVAQDLLKSIPRMESIAWMIAHQFEPLPTEWDTGDREMANTRLGAQILKAAIIFDGFLRKRRSRVEAAHFLTRRFAGLNPKIIEALMELEPEVAGEGTRTVGVADLHGGMVLQQEVRTKEGVLVAAKGQEVTVPLLIKLQSFWKKSAIADSVSVSPKFRDGSSGSPQEGSGAEKVSGISNQA